MNDALFTSGSVAGETMRGSPVRRISASDQIHAALRERIVSLELKPGQNLSRSETAEFYGVSQTPVRDAMLKLQQDGLLVIYPQSKTEVSRIDVEQARETQFLRLSIELEVARILAAAGEPQLLAATRRVLDEQEAALAEGDLDLFSRLDRQFHRSLCEAAGVVNLWLLVTARSGHIDRLRNLNLPEPGKVSNIVHYHRQILAAIEAGDRAGTEEAVRGHLSGTLAAVDEIRDRHPDYF
ncbi:GntR family transcriptional regulator [Amorphus orientalis]|uniref:DNA-binding GntR family transcriptional regulator n=1 Tax=Amorphus orientalis TaxID=649198 RepID=A0AAE3VLU2_9HYPH|nr:GntR family transcriptional regulator [Amorphus orientalis]MDQ0314317.1 DNA-binding GntR family transcriptional regulator [Amorphus orientalis]